MKKKHLYEYAVIRLLPQVEREEFINVGLILFCKRMQFIRVYSAIDEQKLQAFAGDLNMEQVRLNLQSLEHIAMGAPDCGPIAQLDVPSRFRWLTAVRSSAIQTSRPHPGLCEDLEQTARRLFEELVL